MPLTRTACGATIAALVAIAATTTGAQQNAPAAAADWPMYRHDFAGTGHSSLSTITPRNVGSLRQAWTYSLQGEPAPGSGERAAAISSQATPIVVGGTMFVPAAGRIVALDANTGAERWRYSVSGSAPSRRGVAYWPGDGALGPRVVFVAGQRLLSLDAATGRPVASFGENGAVDIGIPYNSVPLVYRNIIVVGANSPPRQPGGIGNPRAFDARTGAKLWEFSAVAQPGDVGHDTWEGDSWKNRLGVNAWPFYFTLDEQRKLLYVPLASPLPDEYGGDRKGANLYGNAVVALDIETGKYRWHFQTIHHDLWDHDPPAPPGLFDIRRDGRTVPALALTTKSGYMYILNRETGQPIFGVEERPVPASDVPGEAAFVTQPFPVKPPPIARNGFAAGDLVTAADTTPQHAAACRELVEQNGIVNRGPFTPWAYRPAGSPPRTTLNFPGGLGGANWGGTTFDPQTGFVIVATQDDGALGWIEQSSGGSFEKRTPAPPAGRATFDVRIGGVPWPCQKPPWGRLIAVNTATGDFAWQVPLGITESLPEGKQQTGRPALAGGITTGSGLLFIASTDDNRFRAIATATGRELWVTKLPRRGNADPMTYSTSGGRQYVAIVATDVLHVYSLP